MDVFGAGLYQTLQVFKYPKAGEANSKVSLHLYDLNTEKLQEINVSKAYNDFYIPRIKSQISFYCKSKAKPTHY